MANPNTKHKIILIIFAIFTSIHVNCALFKTGIRNNGTGAIAGCIYYPDDQKGINNANIIITKPKDKVDQYSNGACSSKSGKFLMTDIPNGYYDIMASALGFHRLIIKNIKVSSDSVTVVKFIMTPSVLQVEVNPIIWNIDDSSIFSIKEFFHSGKIYDFKCE